MRSAFIFQILTASVLAQWDEEVRCDERPDGSVLCCTGTPETCWEEKWDETAADMTWDGTAADMTWDGTAADMTMMEPWCDDGFCCDQDGNCWEDEGRWEDENRGNDYQYYLDNSAEWKDPQRKTWEHKRDFHENCYNWNQFMPCQDYIDEPKEENSECYINYTFDNCGQNYCWIYRGSSWEEEIDLWSAEDCLAYMAGSGYWDEKNILKKRVWAMNEQNQQMYDYWTWYHYFGGKAWLSETGHQYNGYLIWYEPCYEEDEIYGKDTCWYEYGMNQYGDDHCRVWHKSGADSITGQWQWEEAPCRKEYDYDDPEDIAEFAGDNAEDVIETFPQTLQTIAMAICEDESCSNLAEDLAAEVQDEVNDLNNLSQMFWYNDDAKNLAGNFTQEAGLIDEQTLYQLDMMQPSLGDIVAMSFNSTNSTNSTGGDDWLESWVGAFLEKAFEEKPYVPQDCYEFEQYGPDWYLQEPQPKVCEQRTDCIWCGDKGECEGRYNEWGWYEMRGDEWGEFNVFVKAERTEAEEEFYWTWYNCKWEKQNN